MIFFFIFEHFHSTLIWFTISQWKLEFRKEKKLEEQRENNFFGSSKYLGTVSKCFIRKLVNINYKHGVHDIRDTVKAEWRIRNC